MTHIVRCDGCGRQCQDYATVRVTGRWMDEDAELHYCHPPSGNETGCTQYVRHVLAEIGERKAASSPALARTQPETEATT